MTCQVGTIWQQYAGISEQLVAVGTAIDVALSMTVHVDSSGKY